jgi:predicted Zn-dependent protease
MVLVAAASLPAMAAPPLVEILSQELERNFSVLKDKADPEPYFISYNATEEEVESINASAGFVSQQSKNRRRAVDCSIRVGSPEFDNYHAIKGQRPRFTASAPLPIEDSPDAIRRLLWRETDRAWRGASQRYIEVKSSSQTQQEKEKAGDFSVEKPSTAEIGVPPLKYSSESWASRLRKLSAAYSEFPTLLGSGVNLQIRREIKTLVTTEGTRLQHGRTYSRINIFARAKAADGQDLLAMESFEATDPAGLPKDEVILASIRKTGADIARLLRAQPADPYVGPAILSGEAAGVFFHEIFGHRVEGHRQVGETEGQTFTSSVGKPVLPEFLSVVFDPTVRNMAGNDLNGWYAYDDEGIPARRVTVVENGILKTFLLSRMPIPGFPNSNGHGRRQPGLEVLPRQSNLIVESNKKVPIAQLRRMLIEEVVRQQKPYGLYFEKVTGGYTTTRRESLQAFTVLPLVVYKVFADGRPDEILSGADIVGTPLASFAKILATSDQPDVFNGYCGAESGDVPVAAISPALLVSEIEIQRKQNSGDRPPLLPRPSISRIPEGGLQ